MTSLITGREINHVPVIVLVEQWYHETHTFHLPVREATVMCQDIAILFDTTKLKIDLSLATQCRIGVLPITGY